MTSLSVTWKAFVCKLMCTPKELEYRKYHEDDQGNAKQGKDNM
uniref:Uncharacterized protein n=1 Tax=Tetranychus urticae TaxID=32264 RepID=T1K513_TETUR